MAVMRTGKNVQIYALLEIVSLFTPVVNSHVSFHVTSEGHGCTSHDVGIDHDTVLQCCSFSSYLIFSSDFSLLIPINSFKRTLDHVHK